MLECNFIEVEKPNHNIKDSRHLNSYEMQNILYIFFKIINVSGKTFVQLYKWTVMNSNTDFFFFFYNNVICHWLLCFRLATSANTLETLLHGSVGLLSARSGGHLVSLHCYLSPYDLLEERTCSPLSLTDNNGKCIKDRNFIDVNGSGFIRPAEDNPV